jgi:hypothetical protein
MRRHLPDSLDHGRRHLGCQQVCAGHLGNRGRLINGNNYSGHVVILLWFSSSQDGTGTFWAMKGCRRERTEKSGLRDAPRAPDDRTDAAFEPLLACYSRALN